MIKTSTENDLVRFLYDELSINEKQTLQEAILTDDDLLSELENLQSVVKSLKQVIYSPSNRSLSKILDFSKGYHEESV